MVMMPNGRVVEAISESKFARNVLRAFHRAMSEENTKGPNEDLSRKWNEEDLLADWPPSCRPASPRAIN